MSPSLLRVGPEVVRAQIAAVLTAWGMDPDPVAKTAEVMVETGLAGVDSRGVSMLMDDDASRRKGKLNVKARPRVMRGSPVAALMDADAGLDHPASVAAMRLTIAKAEAAGVEVVTVRNSNHSGAAGYCAALAPERGLVGLVTSGTRTVSVVPTRGRKALLGTNPIAFCAPAARNRAFRLDMATSTTAANKVRVFGLNGRTLPEGWAVDGEGAPIRDPAEALRTIRGGGEGGLTPLGGTAETASHKGYGPAMMAHIFGAVLSGGSFSPLRVRTQRPEDPGNLGHFCMALDRTPSGKKARSRPISTTRWMCSGRPPPPIPSAPSSSPATRKRRPAKRGCARASPCRGRSRIRSTPCARGAAPRTCWGDRHRLALSRMLAHDGAARAPLERASER